MDLVQHFKHMERVILGTGFVDLEYFPNPDDLSCSYGGDPAQCPFCNVHFRAPKRKVSAECPCCFKEISLDLKSRENMEKNDE